MLQRNKTSVNVCTELNLLVLEDACSNVDRLLLVLSQSAAILEAPVPPHLLMKG